MEMSTSCTAPTQPTYSASNQQHPRFSEYLNYRSAMSRQMVTADNFTRWMESTDRAENGFTTVYQVTAEGAQLARGWYKNVFGKDNTLAHRYGPFATEPEAVAS